MTKTKDKIVRLLADADVIVGGSRPWDVQIIDERLYERVVSYGSLGLGEAYMDGWWEAERIDLMLEKVIGADIQSKFRPDLGLIVSALKGRLINQQRLRVREVGEKHYDTGNDLFEKMLDKRLVYSCGYWQGAKTLDQAQEQKLDLICKKLGLEKGMTLLDIGSGWGGLMRFAAENYGVAATGITISKEQAAYAEAHKGKLPVETRLMDYKALTGQFDRIVSVGMFEHVGYKNYPAFMQKARELIKPDGLFLLHSIGGNTSATHGEPWSEKYIFPNGMLPSIRQIGAAIEGRFVMEDWHNFGADYEKTLLAWHDNFIAAWPQLKDKYGERFYRMWRYYLMSFAAMFRLRRIELWQIVLSPNGVPGGYKSVR
jgi:cyclopropane-fatty-acyl-phospholipid synthase